MKWVSIRLVADVPTAPGEDVLPSGSTHRALVNIPMVDGYGTAVRWLIPDVDSGTGIQDGWWGVCGDEAEEING